MPIRGVSRTGQNHYLLTMAFPTDTSATAAPESHGPGGTWWGDFRAGLHDGLGMFYGCLIFGMLCGSAAKAAGLDLLQATLMSAAVFAGTAQFAAFAVWSPDMPYLVIVISVAMVCSRLFLMGLSLSPHLRSLPLPGQTWCAFLVNDGGWALTMGASHVRHRAAYYLGTSSPLYILWVAGTALGVLVAGMLDPVTAAALAFSGMVFLAIIIGIVLRGIDAPRLPMVVSAVSAVLLDGTMGAGPATLMAIGAGALVAVAGEMVRK